MVSINGKGNDYNKFFINKDVVKQSESKKAETQEPVVAPKTKEIGDDLLDPRLFTNALGFVRQTAPIAKNDEKMLTEMFAMAGIKGQMPTKEQYDRIATGFARSERSIDKLAIENNAERLFSSPNFQKLNEEFGIS